MKEKMDLKDLVGKHVLSGVQFGKIEKKYSYCDESTTVDFILDDKIISVVENSDDGYRSSMEEIIINRKGVNITNRFTPVEVVGMFRVGSKYEINDIIDFVDIITGKVVLSVGTGDTNDYYPYFVGEWKPENLCLNRYAIRG